MAEDFYWWANEFEHVEGVLAGEKVQLNDFQLFISVNIFCFKKKRNGAQWVKKCISMDGYTIQHVNV